MNRINPTKLLNSKWTAVTPVNKEKHFIVSEIEYDDNRGIVSCQIEAVISKRSIPIVWDALKDDSTWIQGWK